jgi:hypothetical protein
MVGGTCSEIGTSCGFDGFCALIATN